MKVIKVLSNSLLMALDDYGQEVILLGKGIGYKKSIWTRLKKSDIEKIYVLRDRAVVRDIIRLASEVSEEFFALTKDIVTYAVENYGMNLMDYIYLAPTDHLAFAARRVRENIELPDFYTADLRRFNPNEYQVGVYACHLFEQQIGLKLPDSEAANIAFHFINAQKENPYTEQNRKIEELVKQVLNIVRYQFQLRDGWEDGTAYSRLLRHLRMFAERLINNRMEPSDQMDFLYDEITDKCRAEYDCVKKVDLLVRTNYHRELPRQEKLYLTIHFHQLLEENRTREQERK